jgi:hypothetical protein
MRIYFTASLRGKKEFSENYEEIVRVLSKMGHKVYSEHILKDGSQSVDSLSKAEARKNYVKIISEIKKAQVIVAEVSTQSLSVGHELTEVMALNKPLVVLFAGDRKPGLFFGSDYDKMQIVQYELGNVEAALEEAIEEAIKSADVRFNFFVSPKILNYLDWVAKKKRLPS